MPLLPWSAGRCEPALSSTPARRHPAESVVHGLARYVRLCAAGLLAAGPVHADGVTGGCSLLAPPARIEVIAAHAIPQVNFRYAAADIRRELNSGPLAVALGMTQTSTSFSADIALGTVPLRGQPGVCARPRIELTLRHSRIEVRLAREIQDDGCVADVVLKHELGHVAIERDSLSAAAETLRERLTAYYAGRVYVGTEEEINAELAGEFEHRWAPELNALLKAANERHAAYDEADSAYDTRACNGGLHRVARRLQ